SWPLPVLDSVISCSVTGFTYSAPGARMQTDPATGAALPGAPLTAAAFQTGLPGQWGGYIVSLGLAFFAFSTVLGWAYYGERAIEYLLGVRAITPYRILFVIGTFVGAYVLQLQQTTGFQLVWTFSDIMNGLMAIPNLIGLILLSGVVVKETQGLLERRRAPEPVAEVEPG